MLVTVTVGAGTVPVWVDRPLDVVDPAITRAMLVIHGNNRHAEDDFDRIVDLVPDDWEGQVIVVTPEFRTADDAGPGELWWGDDWKEGGDSGGVSSFEVADALVGILRGGTFPNLDWIVVSGHSAGGQFTQRYAAFTDVDDRMKFVPANASSYVYLDGLRWDGLGWSMPIADCDAGEEGYNEYKYGLEVPYGYAADRSPFWVRVHAPARWVEVLVGTEDVDADNEFDDSCAGNRQGADRYERAHNYVDHMTLFHGPTSTSVTDVPGAGHDGDEMFASDQGVEALFFPE